MASILRSGKFVRYFAGFTRSLIFNTVRETEESLVQNTQCLCSSLTHGFATASLKPDQNLDKSLKRLDQDVRRSGRISRRDIEEVLDEIRQQRSATSSQSLLVIRCCGNLVPEELPEVRTALVQEIWKTLNALNVPMDISHYNALLRVYLENEHQFSPTDFLTDLEAKGVEPNRVTFQRLITRYCQQGDIEGATRILEYMREKEHPVNENVFNALILGHSQANDLESAAGILGVMKQAGLEPSADTYTTLLCSYARHGKLEDITRTLNECEQKEIYLLDKDLLDVVYALAINGHSANVDAVLSRVRKSAGYNQDSVNIILRLTNKGYEDVAFEILKTMSRGTRADGELTDTGAFFVRQLVKANRPTEKILKICKEMQDDGLNPKALLIAVESGLHNGHAASALSILHEIKNSGMAIRQHYFWPLICSVEKDEILVILKRMQHEFNIVASNETVREYVIPNLKEKNFEKIVNILCDADVSLSTATSATAYYALSIHKLKAAADLAGQFKAYFNPGLFKRPLIAALSKTNDINSFLKFVRHLYDGLPRLSIINQTENAEDDGDVMIEEQKRQPEVLGQIIHDTVVYLKLDRVEKIEKILTGFVQQGLSISNYQAERIQDRLGAELTANISELLGKLSAGDLEPVQIERSESGRRGGIQTLSIEAIERVLVNAEGRNENTNGLKRTLLNACLKQKNLEKTEELVKKLESENFVLTSGIYAQLIELYCHHEKLDSAISIYEQIKAKEPDFILDHLKTIKVVDLMVKLHKIDEAVKFLEENKKDDPITDGKNFNYKTTCWRVLNAIAETGNVETLQRIFNTMIDNKYIEPNNVILGPLVKVHLVNNDLKKAVDTFEEICNKYQSTPWKNELACRLIQAEDANHLQRLTDLSTNIHGEVNSLYDLVFSFVECGRIRQARKILETPGLRNRPQRINTACERYRIEGMVQPLEGLIEATKDLNHIDRGDIFYNLLLSYCKEDQPEKALGLWTKMQEEDIMPSDAFLTKLSSFLKEKNLEVPFVVPSKAKVSTVLQKNQQNSQKVQQPKLQEPKVLTSIQKLRQAIKSGDADAAIAAKKQIKPEDKINIMDQSTFIETLVKAERLNEATKYVMEMLENKNYPLPRIFKFFLNKLANSGDLSSLEKIGKLVTPEVKKLISFDNRYCHANVVAGKSEQYLNQLLNEIDQTKTDEEVKVVAEKFPRGGALGILEKQPELYAKFEELAEKYASKNHLAPYNTLWIHNFLNNNEEAAKKIWDKYLITMPRLMFQRILQAAREKEDEQMIKKLITHLRESKVSEGAMGNSYSCWLDVLSAKERFDEGLNVLKEAINDVCLENINRTALTRLKDGLERSGKQFPYKIPERKSANDSSSSSSSSTSSSSSDDDRSISKPPETVKEH